MGYALFAQRKLVLDSQLNQCELMQTIKSNAQMKLATQELGLNQQQTSLQAGQALEIADLYGKLSSATETAERDSINAEISKKQKEQEAELDELNREIYKVSVEEQAIEVEVKRLDTKVTAIQKQLEAVEQAEGKAIDRATPKFSGLG